MYTNMLFIKRRSYEFGLLQTIGLGKKSIIYMLMLEQLFIFIITVIRYDYRYFRIKNTINDCFKIIRYTYFCINHFSFQAIAQTLFILVIAYILIIIQASIYLSKSSIKSLMASQDSKEDSHITLTLGEVILGVLGIVLILTGYYLSTRFVEIVDDVILPFVILILTVLGTYFSFEVRFLSF